MGPAAQNLALFLIRQRLQLMMSQRAQARIQIRQTKVQLSSALPVCDEYASVHCAITVVQSVIQRHQHLFGLRVVLQSFHMINRHGHREVQAFTHSSSQIVCQGRKSFGTEYTSVQIGLQMSGFRSGQTAGL